jgi:hypothetical protein
MSDLTDSTAREVVEVCERAGVEYRVVPALSDLLSADAFAGGRRAVGAADPVAARH